MTKYKIFDYHNDEYNQDHYDRFLKKIASFIDSIELISISDVKAIWFLVWYKEKE